MKNPVTTCSGTFGQGDIFKDFFDINQLGALTTKSVTLKPKNGNPPPRIAETPSGYLNAIGLANPGVEAFIKKYGTYFEKLSIPVIVSIAGTSPEEYAEVALRLTQRMPVQGIEINISCPNVRDEGLQFAFNPKAAASVVKAVRKKTALTLLIKLSPNTDQNVAIAKACISEGADAICAINTLQAMAIDVNTRKPKLANITGGLSGPAVKPVALRWVYELSRHIRVPIVGMGGIATAEDALEFIVAGATAVAVGTANFYNPCAVPEIIHGMKSWLSSRKIKSIGLLRNTLRTESIYNHK